MPQTTTRTSALAPGRDPVRLRKGLLICGVVAGPVYVLVSVTQALTREGFDLTRHAWSLLTNGDLGWIQITNLIVSGLLVIAGGARLGRTLGTNNGWAPGLLSGYGLNMVAAGIFPADPALGFPPGTPQQTTTSWQGTVHFVAAGRT